MKIIQLILLSFLVSACNPAKSVKNDQPNAALYQKWIDSREENSTNSVSNIYRPSNFKTFPASRFRMAYTFRKNGTCTYRWLSPIDKHTSKLCTYTYSKGKVQLFDSMQKKLEILRIVSLSANKLVIQKQ
ncbi:MAG TPA: hypothetical protein EYG68_03410 [Leucothrix mucor]|nr:hypothetical protein [Leucothrix mucor]